MCGTVCPAARPLNWAISTPGGFSAALIAFATFWVVRMHAAAPSPERSNSSAAGSFDSTRTCPSACGMMSISATVCSSSYTRMDGSSPRRILAKGFCESYATRSSTVKPGCTLAVVLFSRQFRSVRANGRDQFRRRDLVTHFAVNPRLAFIDFDQKNAFPVFCRFEAQRAKFARRCVVVFGEQGHCPGRPGSAHRRCPRSVVEQTLYGLGGTSSVAQHSHGSLTTRGRGCPERRVQPAAALLKASLTRVFTSSMAFLRALRRCTCQAPP